MVESFRVLLVPVILCYISSSLDLYGIRLVCFHAEKGFIICHKPYAIKKQRGAKFLVGGFECDELVLYGIRLLEPATL